MVTRSKFGWVPVERGSHQREKKVEYEEYKESEKRLTDLGYMDLNHFLEHKYCVSMGLIKFGGSFSRKIGEALMIADRNNALKIMRYWLQDCEHHALLFKMFLAKEKSYGCDGLSNF